MEELIAREFAALREQIAANERHRDDRQTAERDRIAVRDEELDRRLERMNEFRSAMADQAARFVQRTEFDDAKQASMDRVENLRRASESRLEADIAPIRVSLENMGRPNWALLSTAIAMVAAMTAGVWLTIGLKIDSATAPISLTLEQTRVSGAQALERLRFLEQASELSTQSDISSKTDRAQLNERAHALEQVVPTGATAIAELGNLKGLFNQVGDRLQTLRTENAKISAALVEIETQFCAADTMRNLMHANDLRMFSMLWAKSFPDSTYPIENAYYPRVGRCTGQAQ